MSADVGKKERGARPPYTPHTVRCPHIHKTDGPPSPHETIAHIGPPKREPVRWSTEGGHLLSGQWACCGKRHLKRGGQRACVPRAPFPRPTPTRPPRLTAFTPSIPSSYAPHPQRSCSSASPCHRHVAPPGLGLCGRHGHHGAQRPGERGPAHRGPGLRQRAGVHNPDGYLQGQGLRRLGCVAINRKEGHHIGITDLLMAPHLPPPPHTRYRRRVRWWQCQNYGLRRRPPAAGAGRVVS